MDESVAVKVAGALKGVVRISSFESTVAELRAEIARLMGMTDPTLVKIIAAGRNLQDDSKRLCEYNISAASRVLITRGAAAQAALSEQEARMGAEEARSAHLDRLKAALDKMASRDGRGLTDKREFSLENQAGTRLSLSDADRRALVIGLALHEKGKQSLDGTDLQAALSELLLAEDSFGLVSPTILEGVDNFAMLLLDIVWCCYKLRDISRLGVCSERLASARRMLERAHGVHQERLRLLHGNFSPEQAIYVRLELLEGVVAYHSGDVTGAQQHLQAANRRWQKLQLSEQALLSLAEMGYSDQESSRALRFSGGDLAAAVDFLTEQRQRQQEQKQQRKKQRQWNRERSEFGKTADGKYVDMESLDQLCQLGYDRSLAAEALLQQNNFSHAALDILGDPVRRGALQLGLIAKQMLEQEQGPQDVKASHVAQLVEMGFREKAARIALKASGDKVASALEKLKEMGAEARIAAPDGDQAAAPSLETFGAADLAPAGTSAAAAAAGAGSSAAAAADAGVSGAAHAGSSAAAAAGRRRSRDRSREEDGDVHQSNGGDHGVADGGSPEDSDDQEMEEELVQTVTGDKQDDMLSAYDVDVSEDGEAIQMYLSLLESAQGVAGSNQGPSSALNRQ